MELNKIIISAKWLVLFLFITICSYPIFYTSQPHYHISFTDMSRLLTASIDPGIVIISIVTSIVLTTLTYSELKKRSK
jgi:hypothetical protein